MTPLTSLHEHTLQDVAARQVVYYPGLLGGHTQGYGWAGGGEIPPDEQQALAELEVVHLIAPVPAMVCREVGAAVQLTNDGVRALSLWGTKTPAAPSPSSSPGLGVRLGVAGHQTEVGR